MIDALTESLAAQRVIAAGKMPKLYATNLDAPDGLGRCPENGTNLCLDCFGMWSPELIARAITHVERGACKREGAEREHREVPFRPQNMRVFLGIKMPEPTMPSPDTYRTWMQWGWR